MVCLVEYPAIPSSVVRKRSCRIHARGKRRDSLLVQIDTSRKRSRPLSRQGWPPTLPLKTHRLSSVFPVSIIHSLPTPFFQCSLLLDTPVSSVFPVSIIHSLPTPFFQCSLLLDTPVSSVYWVTEQPHRFSSVLFHNSANTASIHADSDLHPDSTW